MDYHLLHLGVRIYSHTIFFLYEFHTTSLSHMTSFIYLHCYFIIAEQKEKLSEVEQQIKKAEAAQRRRMQVEKAAKESEVCFCSF